MLRVFRTMQDPWLLQPLPLVEDPSDGMVTILHQPAGTEVDSRQCVLTIVTCVNACHGTSLAGN